MNNHSRQARVVRPDGRAANQIRPVELTAEYIRYPEGSVLIKMGHTWVLCNVSVQEQVPEWLEGEGRGWLTASYALLPRSTRTRTPREVESLSGRTQEIRRLIGRSLRAAVDLELLGERMLVVDCDVLQADGGTRTASITGGYVAVAIAIRDLIRKGVTSPQALRPPVAAVSVGIVGGEARLDLCYDEDSQADVDLNVAMTEDGRLIEVQGTAEGEPFSRESLEKMMNLAEQGIGRLVRRQQEALLAHSRGQDSMPGRTTEH